MRLVEEELVRVGRGPCGLKGEETAERKAQRDDAVKCVCGARNKAGGIRGAPGTKP